MAGRVKASETVECVLVPTHLVDELEGLRKAIMDAGFGIMKTSAGWSIHDVSEKAKADDERTAQIIAENIDLKQRCLDVRDAVNRYHQTKLQSDLDELDRLMERVNSPDLVV